MSDSTAMPMRWRVALTGGVGAAILIAPGSWLSGDPTTCALIAGGVLFGIAAAALCSAACVDTVNLVLIGVCGATFGFWGFMVGFCVPYLGITGIPQATATGLLVGAIIGRWRVVLWLVLALVPAWGCAVALSTVAKAIGVSAALSASGLVFGSGDLNFPTAVSVWNVIAIIALAIETRAAAAAKFSSAVEGVCGRCGYDLRGLPTTTCPECGQAAPSPPPPLALPPIDRT